ncbi:Nucleoside-diphosphate-sugar epimerase [Filimonas lacunae]|uniref:Nucleoside-diphosphate-sugar epimerase n=1 Tax=Filimonas lacunae TaxID=477680 RepID=A0A173MR48_9BACT|nr:NAD-dependent epimerase/dehydratase family protein [Filimonas lacunae]BAV09920.1 dihydroflavonol-4-reductase [Filimonas lacunae]SIS81069.1 Nucleoside-diphosphate-sugar epimerase [Filimonas lacunae]
MILVTGATGLVGSHLIQSLLQQQQPIRATYRSAIPSFTGAEKVEWVQADILDIISLEQAMQGVKQVYHCAAIVSFHPKQKETLQHTNVNGTENVVNACLLYHVEKLLFVSSVAALGRIREKETINETMYWTPETSNSEYGKTKYLAEMEVWRGIGEGLNAVIVNPVIILGAGDWEKGSSELFKTAYKEFPWYTEGVTGFVDVADVVKAMVGLMNSNISGERFIISAENITYRQLFTSMAQCFGKRPPHRNVTPLIAAIVWRLEAVKGMLSGKAPLLTKETAHTAQAKVYFDNSKLLKFLPDFRYKALSSSITDICGELKKKYQLP